MEIWEENGRYQHLQLYEVTTHPYPAAKFNRS